MGRRVGSAAALLLLSLVLGVANAGGRTLAALAKFHNENGIQPGTTLDASCVSQLQGLLSKAAATSG